MYSLINAGQGIGGNAIVVYIIDTHQEATPEAFALINFVSTYPTLSRSLQAPADVLQTENIMLYILVQYVAQWVIGSGVNQTLNVLAGLSALCILTGVPMYMYVDFSSYS